MSRGPAARVLPEWIWLSVESMPGLSVTEATDHVNKLLASIGEPLIKARWYHKAAARRKERRIVVGAAVLDEVAHATSPAGSPMEVDVTPSAEPVAKAARLDGTPRTCGHLCLFAPPRQWPRTHRPAAWAPTPRDLHATMHLQARRPSSPKPPQFTTVRPCANR